MMQQVAAGPHQMAHYALSLIHIYFARIPAEDCEKIDFIFVTPQVLVKNCEIPAEVPEALLSDHNPLSLIHISGQKYG